MKISNICRYSAVAAVAALAVLPLVATSCGGGGGGIFGGVTRAVGQAVRPLTGVIESNPVPLGRAPVALVDFADGEVGRIARTTDVGTTDDNGNFAVDIPAQTVAIIIVRGQTDQGAVRIAGLVNPNEENVTKNFDGITDIACESALSAINDGTVTPDQVTPDRVKNLEDASAQYLQVNPNVNFFDAAQVSAAARVVREVTNVGAIPAPEGAFGGDQSAATPTPTPTPAPGEAQQCSAGTFTCDDGTVICTELVCNQQNNCPDESDEASTLCSDQGSCCQATQGCASETATSCGTTCCCCGLNEICNRSELSAGCVEVAAKSNPSPADSLSKLLFDGPYWN